MDGPKGEAGGGTLLWVSTRSAGVTFALALLFRLYTGQLPARDTVLGCVVVTAIVLLAGRKLADAIRKARGR